MLSVQVIGYSDDDEDEESDSEEDSEEEDEDEDEEDSSDEDEDDSDDDDDDDDSEEDAEDLHDCEINLINVTCEQYTRSITDITSFRGERSFYPVTRMLLE